MIPSVAEPFLEIEESKQIGGYDKKTQMSLMIVDHEFWTDKVLLIDL